MNWAMLLQNLPAILQAILSVEHAFHKDIPGPAKKELLMNTAKDLPPDEQIMFSQLIDASVKTLNAHGVLDNVPPPIMTTKPAGV